jgi:hypothetical protein
MALSRARASRTCLIFSRQLRTQARYDHASQHAFGSSDMDTNPPPFPPLATPRQVRYRPPALDVTAFLYLL